MLNFRKGTLQDELLQYAEALHGQDVAPSVTPAAVCKARKNLRYPVFIDLNQGGGKEVLHSFHPATLAWVPSLGRRRFNRQVTQYERYHPDLWWPFRCLLPNGPFLPAL
jgi:hypothetical protein